MSCFTLHFLPLSFFPPLSAVIYLLFSRCVFKRMLFPHVLQFVPLASSVILLLFPVSFWFVLSFFSSSSLSIFFSGILVSLVVLPASLSPVLPLPLDIGFVYKSLHFCFLTCQHLCLAFGSFFFVKHNKQLRRKDSLVPCFEHENCVLRNGVWSWLLQHI